MQMQSRIERLLDENNEQEEEGGLAAFFQPPLVNFCVRSSLFLTQGFNASNVTESDSMVSCARPGITIEILKYVFAILNIPLNLIAGNQNLNETEDIWEWTKRNIVSGNISLSANLFAITGGRQLEAEFSMPILSQRRAFIIQTPTASQAKLRLAILKPFPPALWATLFACTAATFAMLVFLHQFQLDRVNYDSVTKSMRHHFWVIVRLCVNQGLSHQEELDSGIHSGQTAGRVVTGTFLLILLFLSLSYTGSILLHLFFVPSRNLPFRGMDELAPLVASGQYRLIIDTPLKTFINTLPTVNTKTYITLRNAVKKNPPIVELKIRRMLSRIGENSKLVMISNTMEAAWLIGSSCNLTMIKDAYDSGQPMGFAFAPNSQLRKKVDFVISQMREVSGSITNKYQADYLFSNSQCMDKRNFSRPLSGADIQDVFWMYGTLITAGTAILVAEISHQICLYMASYRNPPSIH